MLPLIAGAGISAIGSLIGGIFGNRAAKKAAQVQSDAAHAAGQQVLDATNQVNPQIRTAAETSRALINQGAGEAGASVWSATDRANALLNPYRVAGEHAADTLDQSLLPGGDFNREWKGATDMYLDPGYQFRIEQGQKALERSRAAAGSYNSGSTLKALTRFAQGVGSEEYEKAFNRFQTDTAGRFSRVSDLAKLGYSASGKTGDNTINAGTYSGDAVRDASIRGAGLNFDAETRIADNTLNANKIAADYNTNAAAAKAGGIVGGSNALWGGISGAASGVGNAITLGNLLKNPATSPTTRPYYNPSGSVVNPDGSLTVRRN